MTHKYMLHEKCAVQMTVQHSLILLAQVLSVLPVEFSTSKAVITHRHKCSLCFPVGTTQHTV
eukprot:12329-Heterococcus_DN1.PRE.1